MCRHQLSRSGLEALPPILVAQLRGQNLLVILHAWGGHVPFTGHCQPWQRAPTAGANTHSHCILGGCGVPIIRTVLAARA